MNQILTNCVIGIDPGAQGGIAVYIPGQQVKVAKMPKDIAALRDFFQYYAENYKPLVFLEKLSVRPDDVRVEGDRAAMGKLYRIQAMMANFEHLKATMEAAGVPYILTHPLQWQTKLNLRKRGVKEDKSNRKHRYQQYAQANYPGVKVTLWNADALCIMHFGRVMIANDPKWIISNLPTYAQQLL